MKRISTLVCLIFFVFFGAAQKTVPEMVTLFLKDGSRLKGHILSEDEDLIEFRLFGGYDMEVDPREVEKREKGEPGRTYFTDGRWYTEKGYYSVLSLNTTWGRDDITIDGNGVLTGLKLQTVNGYKFNRFISLGLALSIHSFELPDFREQLNFYYYNDNFTTLPIELDIRGYLKESRIAPYYAIQAGYGIAIFKNAEQIEQSGGVSGQLEVGVRFAGRKMGSFQLGTGYLFQDVEALYRNDFNSGARFTRVDSRAHRFLLNFGWNF